MRLCWIVPADSGGGVVSVALSCCREAAASGHEVTLLCVTPLSGSIDEYVTFSLKSLGLEKRGPRNPAHFISWLKRNPQDVLFINNCSSIYEALPHTPDGVRIVFVAHDTASVYWLPVIHYEDVLDAIVAVSETVARCFRTRLRSANKLFVIHNGTVFPGDVSVEPFEERQDDLIFLGGEKSFKGANDVVKLWSTLVKYDFEGRLHWFGHVQGSFRDRVKQLNQSSRIKMHGHAPRSLIFEHAASAKVILVPSRAESFGMAAVEGMGMGCLPVAWDIESGIKEIVDHDRTGFLARLGDIEALTRQVVIAFEKYQELAPVALAKARRQFSEREMWRRYESNLLDVLLYRVPVKRPKAGKTPPQHEKHTHFFQLLPVNIRQKIRKIISRSPRLAYWLRNLRGM